MFSLAYTHAVVSMIGQEHFLDPTAHHLPHRFLLCVAKLLQRVVHNHCLIPLLPFTLKPTPVVSPPLYPRNYTCQGQKWLCDSDLKVSWSLFPCPSAGFDIINSSFLTHHLASRTLAVSCFLSLFMKFYNLRVYRQICITQKSRTKNSKQVEFVTVRNIVEGTVVYNLGEYLSSAI